jgi:ATP-dependent Clp protease ATP-binding subunit ClpC
MFERYTEKARRVIFFARYEASQFGSPYIETEHMLLGLLREDKALTNRFLRSHASVESIRKQIEAHTTIREKVSTSVDLPLSNECKRVLAYAAEEAERLGHKHIGTEHLLLGLLREEKSFAAEILKERGVLLATVREELARVTNEPAVGSSFGATPVNQFSRDLTQEAMDGKLEPLVGRELELDGVIEVLCSRGKKNPLLIGGVGVGKTAIVEGLALMITEGKVPEALAPKRMFLFDAQLITGVEPGRQRVGDQLKNALRSKEPSSELIVFIDNLRALVAMPGSGSAETAKALKSALAQGEIQCIATSTPGDYATLTQAIPWLGEYFRSIHVSPLDEKSTLSVLQANRHRLEKFHGVTYSDDAIECAVQSSSRYLPEKSLPGKAMELLDAAGARVKLRQEASPAEIADVLKRLRFITSKTEAAIQNHEFEKARFYSDEERKERENLKMLREKYRLDESDAGLVSREAVEDLVSRWAKYPFQL